MWKKLIIIITISSYLLICYIIYTTYKEPQVIKKNKDVKENNIISSLTNTISIIEEKPIGKLTINKINLSEELYDMNSQKNNIEEHVTILSHSKEPSIKNSTIFIAAHSGTGKIAYFNKLNKLVINDHIILEYKNTTYTYKVKNIWEDKKTGTITVPKENTNQLILTTCSPNKDNYQLIINCILI